MKLIHLLLLQRQERKLLRRWEKNRLRQLKVVSHPRYQQRLQRELTELRENQQLPRPEFSLNQLL